MSSSDAKLPPPPPPPDERLEAARRLEKADQMIDRLRSELKVYDSYRRRLQGR